MIKYLLILSFISFRVYSKDICLTGTTVKLFPKYEEAFYNGALLATKKNKKVKLRKFYYDRTPLAALEAYKKMVSAGCHLIIGFSTGNDLISISGEAKKLKVPVISIYGDNSEIIKQNEYIHTIQPSPKYLLNPLIEKIKRKNKIFNKALVVTAVDRHAMNVYKKHYLEILTENGIKYKEINILERKPNFTKLNEILENEKFDSLVLLTRSLLGSKITGIVKNKNKVVILGTKYFGSSALPAYLNYLENKNVDAYFSRHNCLCDDDNAYLNFIKKYKNEFNKKPMVISASAYDLVTFYIHSLAKGKESDLLNLKKTEYKGITGVRFSKGLKIDFTKHFQIHISEKGYNRIWSQSLASLTHIY